MPRVLPKRTHYCGDLRPEHVGERAVLMGWVQTNRDHGGLIFVDLRDRAGIVQIVANPETAPDAHAVAERCRSEWVVCVQGVVRERSEETRNPKLGTGDVEVIVDAIQVLNEAKTPPFPVEDDAEVGEDVRLRYRFVDLRRPKMAQILRTRHEFILETRKYLDSQGFIEVETPFLLGNTPEGARDFVVPSRLNPGRFYALPQSPQLLKQTLMVAGVDRYFQIARCMRDEDLRADRQPEFTQIDIEMSFVEQDDVLELNEDMIAHLFRTVAHYDPPRPFQRLTYEDALDRYGSDKPDLRYGLEIVDVSDIVGRTEFNVFTGTVAEGGTVRCINAKGCASFSRSELDALQPQAQKFGGKGAAWIAFAEGGMKGPVGKHFGPELERELRQRTAAEDGDLLVFCADQRPNVLSVLGQMRQYLANKLGLRKRGEFRFCWVLDFPLFEFDEELGQYIPMHHPFSMPRPQDVEKLDTDPGSVIGQLYDLVLNGNEIGSGSIRIHRRDIQQKVFNVIRVSEEDARRRFGFLLGAFEYGAPPHGGFAHGLDRIVAEIVGVESIRDVIAFPKTATGTDLMTGAPNVVPEEQLAELHVRLSEQAAAAVAELQKE